MIPLPPRPVRRPQRQRHRTPQGLWRRAVAHLVVLAVPVAALLVLGGPNAQAIPIRGHTPWSVLLCRFADVPATPQPVGYFERMFGTSGAGAGAIDDYFADQSLGIVRHARTDVRGWYSMPFTVAQQRPKSRWQKIQDCVAAAAAGGYRVPSGNRVVVAVNAPIDSGAAGGQVLLDPNAWNIAFAAHEMGHGYNLGHSFSNDPTYRNASWSQIGEYDDEWDLMSAMHVYGWTTPTYGNGGVGLNAYHRDKLGWLPQNRVVTVGADGVGSRLVDLAPLESPAASGPLLVRVPFDPADPFSYYTVEYRLKTGWSRGIPASTVLIHKVRNGTPTVLRDYTLPGRPATTSVTADGVTIRLVSQSAHGARVQVSTAATTRCLMGYVWREARPGDLVCVTGATRAQTRADNAVRASRWVSGRYGPHTCRPGYVWREAFPGDDVCVTRATRSQASADNAAAASRRNPARFVYGPNTCASGFVWRSADQTDYVCVTGTTRAQARADNAVRSSRWVWGAYGPHTCRQGFVWRDAWPGDDVCVTGAVRAQARVDNAAAAARVARAGG